MRIAAVVAVVGVGTAGCVELDAMTPASRVPAAVTRALAARDVDLGSYPRCFYGVAHGGRGPQCSAPPLAPRPAAAKAAKKHHVLRALLAPLRFVRHVHRVFRIARNPFNWRRWFW